MDAVGRDGQVRDVLRQEGPATNLIVAPSIPEAIAAIAGDTAS